MDPRALRANVRIGAVLLVQARGKRTVDEVLVMVEAALDVLGADDTLARGLVDAWMRVRRIGDARRN